ncbi:MAG: flagellar hook-basal body complex protein [Pseudomonadota bacterium]
MGISSSLNAGVMGLAVNATKLATISENIANSATPGYKRVDTEFNSMVLQAGSGAFTAGGVRATTTRFVAEEGPLQATGNSTDISVSGEGFIPVTNFNGLSAAPGARDELLVTTGSFRPDENGLLRTQSDQYLMGWPIDGDGNVIRGAQDSGTGLVPVNIRSTTLDSAPTTEIQLGVNLPATSAQAGAPLESFSAPIEYFDNVGRPQVLTVSFTPTISGGGAANEWSVEVFDGASPTPDVAIGEFTMEFRDEVTNPGTLSMVTSGTGATYDPATGLVTVPGVQRGPITLDIGLEDGTSNITQLAASFSPLGISKNGSSVGDLVNVEIAANGTLEAVFNNGFRQPIYQIPVGMVPNVNGLAAVGGQAYQVSQNSGDVFYNIAGEGAAGTTIGFALEGSTTEVAAELTALIETQRAYSSNARIITTVDEILEETTNLKR